MSCHCPPVEPPAKVTATALAGLSCAVCMAALVIGFVVLARSAAPVASVSPAGGSPAGGSPAAMVPPAAPPGAERGRGSARG